MIHFLSDLHLSPGVPGVTRLFLHYLAGAARSAGQIFILGDLFEAWPGDDALDDPEEAFSRDIAQAIRRLTNNGTRVAVQRGNRDFLLGERFAERSGALLLPDVHVLRLPARQFVLVHGDTLCTDDAEYQAFRAQTRTPAWRDAFLGKPLGERKMIAAALRRKSEASKQGKPRQVMDVNPAATEDFLRQYGYATLIHGHTHRPDRHDHLIDGIHVERWVLADWHEDRGEFLAWDGQRLARHDIRQGATTAR